MFRMTSLGSVRSEVAREYGMMHQQFWPLPSMESCRCTLLVLKRSDRWRGQCNSWYSLYPGLHQAVKTSLSGLRLDGEIVSGTGNSSSIPTTTNGSLNKKVFWTDG